MKIGKAIDSFLFFIVHSFFKTAAWIWLKVFQRAEFINASNIPLKGGFIAAGNHESFFDPPLMGLCTWRRMFRFIARDTLFKVPVWGTLLRYMGAIPLKRASVDRGAWDKIIDTIKEGHVVGLFPEGTRTPDGEIHEGKPGTGMLVYRSRCMVIPVYIHGGFRAWKKGTFLPVPFRKVTVIYGKPMSFEEEFKKEASKQVYIEITKKIMDELKIMRVDYAKRLADRKK